MSAKLDFTFTMRAYLSKENGLTIAKANADLSRVIIPITHGFLEGSGLKSTIAGGGDWLQTDPTTDLSHLNVRTQARTADGYSLYVYYGGILQLDEAGKKVLRWAPDAKTTQFGDHNWFVRPIIETDHPTYKWVESSMFVGQGRFVVDEEGSAVEYRIYRVAN